MTVQGRSTQVDPRPLSDAALVLGELAGCLGSDEDLSSALEVLVSGLGLRSAAVRSAAGDLVAIAGDAVRALSAPVLELAIPVPGGAPAALTVTGARPSNVSHLRAAASILGLALGQSGASPLLDAAEADRSDLADLLHDGPVQALVVARLASDLAVRGGSPENARDAVQDALVALRRQLWQIRPRGAEGLVPALEQLSAQRIAAGLPALGLVVDPDVALTGSAATLAYRLVQAVSGTGALRVAVRADGQTTCVDVDGDDPLPAPERWVLRARSVGGDLSASAGRLRLVLPSSARTAS